MRCFTPDTCTNLSSEAGVATSAPPRTTPQAAPPPRTWAACAGLYESEVPLASLDPAVRFDDDYPDPIRYDASRRVLRYRGRMSHASFMRLQVLSNDRSYQRALEQLFVASALPPEARAPVSWVLWPALAAGLLVALLAAGWFGRGWLAPGGRPAVAAQSVDAAPAMPPAAEIASLEPARSAAATAEAPAVEPSPVPTVSHIASGEASTPPARTPVER
jgi:hypothetical protein